MVPTCIDSTTDPNNCGVCGTKCDPTVACIAGKCGKAPSALVAAATGCKSIHLVYDGGKIYWTDEGHGTVKSIATTAGATATSLATGEMGPAMLLVNNGTVYWIDNGNGSIRSVAAGGGTATTLVAMPPAQGTTPPCDTGCMSAYVDENKGIHGLTFSPDGNTLFFSAGTDVFKVAKTGGAVTNVGYSEGPRHGIPGALAVDAKYAYYPTGVNGNVEILPITMACDVAEATSTEPTCPLRQARSQTPLVLDTIYLRGDKLYWGVGQAIRVGSIGAKLDAGLSGVDGTDYSPAINAGNITGFALGTTNAYFGEFPAAQGNPEDGLIERAGNPPYTGANPPNAVVIARKQPNPTSFAVDGTNVFWTTSDCDIEMIADSPQ
jgi:hypothetical protein